MAVNSAGKPRFFYRLTWKRKKSGEKKYKKAMEWYLLVLKKQDKVGGEDKWILKTKEKVMARFKKYGIVKENIKKFLENKNLWKKYEKIVEEDRKKYRLK